AQGVDGLVYAATDAQTLSQVTEQALAAHKAVANVDSGTYPQPAEVPLFATNNVAASSKATDLLADAVGPGDKEVAFLKFNTNSQTGDERARGFKEGLARHPNLRL